MAYLWCLSLARSFVISLWKYIWWRRIYGRKKFPIPLCPGSCDCLENTYGVISCHFSSTLVVDLPKGENPLEGYRTRIITVTKQSELLMQRHHPSPGSHLWVWTSLCLSPQKTFGVSGVNSVAAKSNTIDVTGDRVFNCKKNNRNKPWKASTLLLWCHPSVSEPRHSKSTWNCVIYTM